MPTLLASRQSQKEIKVPAEFLCGINERNPEFPWIERGSKTLRNIQSKRGTRVTNQKLGNDYY